MRHKVFNVIWLDDYNVYIYDFVTNVSLVQDNNNVMIFWYVACMFVYASLALCHLLCAFCLFFFWLHIYMILWKENTFKLY